MFDGGMTMSLQLLSCPPSLLRNVYKNKNLCKVRLNQSSPLQLSSILVPTDKSGNSSESNKISGSGTSPTRNKNPSSLLSQPNTVGIIGGVSVFSTLIFLEKLVWWSSRDGEECIPFVVCNDPGLNIEHPSHGSLHLFRGKNVRIEMNHSPIIENLRCKRVFLEDSGARCIAMPCHVSHAWYDDICEGCSVPFFHVGQCVAKEIKEAKLKPIEAGSDVRIGILGTDVTLSAGFYQENLQNQGFEVVLPDKATMEHIVIPSIEALKRRDMAGARNLLRVAIQILMVRGVNKVILASHQMQGLLPRDDPLLKRCIDPMDALARSTIKWAKCKEKECVGHAISGT